MAQRLLPLSGIVYFAIAVGSFVFVGGDTPGIDATPAKITSFYVKHHGAQSTVPFALAIGVLFLVLFGASLWYSLVSAGSPPARIGGAIVLVGIGISAAGYLVAAGIHLALAQAVHHGIGPLGAQALNALDAEDFQVFAIGTAIALLGAGSVMTRSPGLTRWLGWVALLVGVASFTPIGFFGFLAANVWIAVISIRLSISAGRALPEGGNA